MRWPRFGCARRRRWRGVADGDLAAVGEADEAGGDHAFGRREPALDHGLRLILLLHHDRAHRHGVVVLDHVDESAVGAALHRAGRDGDHAFQRVDQQPHIDELAGPEHEAGIGKLGLELDRAGGLIDLVVDHAQGAAVDHRVAVWALCIDAERALGEGVIDPAEVLLRQIEQHRDRLELCDHHDGGIGVGGAHDVAFVDHADAGAAVDRGDHAGVGKRRARIFHRRDVELHQRAILRDQRALGVGLLLVDRVGRRQSLVAVEIDLGVGELGFVLRLLGQHLVERGLIGGRIDARQHVAFFDVLAFLEGDADQFAVDLRAHGNGIERFDRPDGVEIDRHVGLGGGGGEHRHRPARRAEAAATLRRGADLVNT